MALYEFSGVTVRDAQGIPAAGATGAMYDKDDASFSTPLTVTDLNGLPLTLVSDQFGQLPDFQITDKLRAVWKPSDPSMPTTTLLSMDGVVKAADDAAAAALAARDSQLAAEAAQSSAASLAAGVVRTVNGVAPDSGGNVAVSGGGGGSGSAVTSVAGKTGAVSLVKADVGLSNVDNTSDANKPVSTPQAAALAAKANAAHTHVVADTTGLQAALDSKAGVNAAVNASQITAGTGTIPASKLAGVVKTVNGVAPDGAGNVNVSGSGGGGDVLSVNGKTGAVVLAASDVGALASSYTPPVTSVAGLTGAVVLNKNNVGLTNVDNTADSAKPVSTLQAAAIAAKADDTAVVHKSGAETIAGVKTFSAAPVVPDGAFPIAKVSGLAAALLGVIQVLSGSSVTLTHYWVGTVAAYNAMSTPRMASCLYIKVG